MKLLSRIIENTTKFLQWMWNAELSESDSSCEDLGFVVSLMIPMFHR
jgi:hypothetical protein